MKRKKRRNESKIIKEVKKVIGRIPQVLVANPRVVETTSKGEG